MCSVIIVSCINVIISRYHSNAYSSSHSVRNNLLVPSIALQCDVWGWPSECLKNPLQVKLCSGVGRKLFLSSLSWLWRRWFAVTASHSHSPLAAKRMSNRRRWRQIDGSHQRHREKATKRQIPATDIWMKYFLFSLCLAPWHRYGRDIESEKKKKKKNTQKIHEYMSNARGVDEREQKEKRKIHRFIIRISFCVLPCSRHIRRFSHLQYSGFFFRSFFLLAFTPSYRR